MDLNSRVAIVTGGAKGIGKAAAKLFLEKGCRVVINSRTKSEVESTVKELGKIGQIIGLKADVSNSKDVKRLVIKAVKDFGRIDILVNNAGVLHRGPLMEMKEEEWDETVGTNLKGIFLCIREVLPYMRKQRNGIIVNISSGAGHHAFSNLAAYSATKFGVLAITSALSDEVKTYGVKVFSVCPGTVATRMQEEFVGKTQYKFAKHLMISPEKIARKVVEVCQNEGRSGSCFDIFF